MTTRYRLPFSEREGTALFRALVQYETSLKLSSIYDSELVEEEIQIVRDLQERVSLQSYVPETEETSNAA